MIDVGTFWELVEARARQSRDTPMLLDEHEREQSFAAYRDAAERAAGGLVKLGIGPGTRVAYQLPTRLETIVLMGALARLGATQIPLIPIYREREVAFCLAQTGAEHFVTPGTWGGTDFAALARKAFLVQLVVCQIHRQENRAVALHLVAFGVDDLTVLSRERTGGL